MGQKIDLSSRKPDPFPCSDREGGASRSDPSKESRADLAAEKSFAIDLGKFMLFKLHMKKKGSGGSKVGRSRKGV